MKPPIFFSFFLKGIFPAYIFYHIIIKKNNYKLKKIILYYFKKYINYI